MTDVAGSEVATQPAQGTKGVRIPTDSGPGVPASIDVYLVRTRRQRPTIFLTRRALASYASSEKDRFIRFVRRMMRSKNRVIRFVGRVSRMGHRYYQRLEDKIDPVERMIKALNYPGTLRVWHAPRPGARDEFVLCLRKQVVKHTVWVALDGCVTVVAILMAPFMVPIPGPNVSFFYPFLRLLSHRQALRGARRGLADPAVSFAEMPELAGVANSDTGADDPEEPVEGLAEFLRRAR